MKEYMVHCWGQMFNSDLKHFSIEKDYGIKGGYYYFDSEEDMNAFIGILNNKKYSRYTKMIDKKAGELVHKRTVFVGTFKYKDNEFTIHYDFGYEYSESSAKFAFLEGSYSCDCNRSLFIIDEYGVDAIPELDCGNEIELVDYHIEYWSERIEPAGKWIRSF